MIFWFVTLFSFVDGNDVVEDPAASFFRVDDTSSRFPYNVGNHIRLHNVVIQDPGKHKVIVLP